MLPTQFWVNWPSVQEKKRKIDFQDGRHGGHLGFQTGTILAIFDLPSYQVSSQLAFWFKRSKKKDFQNGHYDGHLVFMIGTNLAIFDLQVTPRLPTKFRVNWPFGSEEVKNRFSRWPPWWPSWISNRNDFSYFWSTSHPDASYQVSSQLALRFKWSEKQIFKMAAMVAILEIHQNYFSYFWSTSHSHASYQVLSQLALGCMRSRLLKQLLTPHNGRHMQDGHWLTTIARLEHFVLRWANKVLLIYLPPFLTLSDIVYFPYSFVSLIIQNF